MTENEIPEHLRDGSITTQLPDGFMVGDTVPPGTLILNNWELFKKCFPQQSWMAAKIDELANCRNLVAHDSSISEHEGDIIRVNFNSITGQIKSALESPF